MLLHMQCSLVPEIVEDQEAWTFGDAQEHGIKATELDALAFVYLLPETMRMQVKSHPPHSIPPPTPSSSL